MQIKVLFDKQTQEKNLHTGWGLSLLIDDKVLFDTGENGQWLIHNIKNLNIDLNKLEKVVISHEHWDHTGGLGQILNEKKGLKVYVCPGVSAKFKKQVQSSGGDLIETDRLTQISENIYASGQIQARFFLSSLPEQALILKTEKGLGILTGCAHPGIIEIIEKVKQEFPANIYLVLGGFHLLDKTRGKILSIIDTFKKLGIKKVAPTHCTGNEAIKLFREQYNDNFIEVRVGQLISV